MARVLPLALRRIVFCVRKCRGNLAICAHCIPSAVIKVQVTIDDDINLFRHDAGGEQIIK